MRKSNNKIKALFSIIVMLTICIICTQNYAIMAEKREHNSVSYGIGIFLQIWQWLQYIIPIVLTTVLIILNQKKNNFKKIIMFFLIGIVTFGACYLTGELVLKNSEYKYYSSGRMDMITYNGKNIYVHK